MTMVELPNITVRQSLNNFSGLIATRRNVDLDYEKYHRFNLNGQHKYAASVLEENNKGAFVVQVR